MQPARSTRPALLWSGLTADRRSPDFEALASERDPERFVWRVLPHAARSFAASIVVLPPDQARAAAVGYLYCRMLDSYEDLIPDTDRCTAELRLFAERLHTWPPPPPAPIPALAARDARDEVYLLLIERCDMVDEVFSRLDAGARARIRDLVGAMAEGMVWAKGAFSRQGGVLLDEDQLARYCHSVIGHPAVFTLEMVSRRDVSPPARADALAVSEMIQLANITRDIERDLERGVGYHPALEPYLGRSGYEPGPKAVVRDVREELVAMALRRAPAYRRLFEGLDLGDTAAVRLAAVMMLLFTDLHYRSCAGRTGNHPWRGPGSRLGVVAGSLPALLSPRWAGGVVRRVEARFLAGAARLQAPNLAMSLRYSPNAGFGE